MASRERLRQKPAFEELLGLMHTAARRTVSDPAERESDIQKRVDAVDAESVGEHVGHVAA